MPIYKSFYNISKIQTYYPFGISSRKTKFIQQASQYCNKMLKW